MNQHLLYLVGLAAVLFSKEKKYVYNTNRGILMVQDTSEALKAALMQMMQEKPLDKITIADIAEIAGINRQTFYYHYHDIYEVVEEIFVSMGKEAFEDRHDFESWHEGLRCFLSDLQKEQTFVEHCVKLIPAQEMAAILCPVFENAIEAVMRDTSAELILRPQDRQLIEDFYRYALIGVILEWIDKGMPDDISFLADRIYLLVKDGLIGAVSGCMHLD